MEGMWFRAIISSGVFFLLLPTCLPGSTSGDGLWGWVHFTICPADVLVPNWDLGKPAAFDFPVTSTLHSSVLLEASMTAGSAALVAEKRKHNTNDRKCEELGWVCIPLVVETYGCWGAATVAAFSKLAGCLSTRLNQPKFKTIFGLYSRLGLALVRANCRAIQSRLTLDCKATSIIMHYYVSLV